VGGLEWWHIVIIVAVLFVLFGYKKLPSATKSLAQSMKIFKDETKGLVHGDDHAEPAPTVATQHPTPHPTQHPTHDNAGAIAAPVFAPPPAPAPNLSKDPAAVAATPAPAPAEQPVAVAPPANSLAPRPGAYAAGSQQPR
jgi:sec-independent protein translocase protein TatA